MSFDLFSQPPVQVYDRNNSLSLSEKKAIYEKSSGVMGLVYQWFEQDATRQISADRLAGIIGKKVLSVRCRFSELKKIGYLIETDQSEIGYEGKMVAVCRKKNN